MPSLRFSALLIGAWVAVACSGPSAVAGISEDSTAAEVERVAVALGTAQELGFTDTENPVMVSSSESGLLLAGTDGEDTVTAVELRIEHGAPVLRDRVEIDEDGHFVSDPEAISSTSGDWVVSTSGCGDECPASSRFFYVLTGDRVRRLEPLAVGQPSQLRWLGELDAGRVLGQLFTYDASDGTPDPRSRFVLVDVDDGTAETLESDLLNRPGIDQGVPEPSQLVCAADGRIDVLDVLVGGDLQLTRSSFEDGAIESGAPRVLRPQIVGTPRWVECRDDDTTVLVAEDHATSTAALHVVRRDGTVERGPSREWTGSISGRSEELHSMSVRYGELVDMESARAAFEAGMTPDEYLRNRAPHRVLLYARGRWLDLPAPGGTMSTTGNGRLGLMDQGQTFSAVVIDEDGYR